MGNQSASSKVAAYAAICKKLITTYEAKNHDYGDSYSKLRDKYPQLVLIHLSEKLSRLETLMGDEAAKVNSESLEDTLLDIAGYAVMELIERKVMSE